MPEQTRPRGTTDHIPANQPTNKEQAEGSREHSPSTDDPRDSVAHDRQSPIINPDAERDGRRGNTDIDPVMPTDDSTLRTQI